MFANDHCTGKLNYVKLIRESIWFAMIDSRIDSVRNILIRCTPTGNQRNKTKLQRNTLKFIHCQGKLYKTLLLNNFLPIETFKILLMFYHAHI